VAIIDAISGRSVSPFGTTTVCLSAAIPTTPFVHEMGADWEGCPHPVRISPPTAVVTNRVSIFKRHTAQAGTQPESEQSKE
jgi:hypothetical protein